MRLIQIEHLCLNADKVVAIRSERTDGKDVTLVYMGSNKDGAFRFDTPVSEVVAKFHSVALVQLEEIWINAEMVVGVASGLRLPESKVFTIVYIGHGENDKFEFDWLLEDVVRALENAVARKYLGAMMPPFFP